MPESTGFVDWSDVHRRLESTRLAIEQDFETTPEDRQKILQARAKALARELRTEEQGEQIEIVAFILAYEHYGIESSFVREIYPLKEFTALPCTPPFVLGIINVRGQILSVIDIKKFFDLPEKGLTDLNKVIVARTAEMEFGILADAILGVRHIPVAEIQPSVPTLTGIRADYLRGVTKDRLAILDIAEMLADRRIIVHEEVET